MANFVNPDFNTDLSSWNAGKNASVITGGICCWIDANQQTGYSDGDTITTVTDHTGNSNTLTASATPGITYETNEINGKPVFRFTNAGRLAKTSSVTGEPLGDAELTVFVVHKPSAQVNADTIMNFGTDGNNFALHFIYRTAVNRWCFDRWGFSNEAQFAATSTGTTYLFAGRRVSTTRTAYTNGAEGGSESTSINLQADSLTLGDINTNAIYYAGDIAEWILYSGDLSDADFADMHSYLAFKYGLTLTGRGATGTRDTGTKYEGAASLKVVATNATRFFENINPGASGDFFLTGYVYTDSSEVTSSDVELYYDGAAVTTAFTSVGSGWYKMSATVTGADAVKTVGVEVKAGITAYLDSFDLSQNQPPSTPTNSTPTNGATGFLISGGTLTASAFSDPDGTADTHGSSIWQVATDTGFASVAWTSNWSTAQLEAATINTTNGTFTTGTALGYLGTYYWHVSYADDKGGSSAYSSYTNFVTEGSPVEAVYWSSETVKNLAKAPVDVARRSQVSWTGTVPSGTVDNGVLRVDSLNNDFYYSAGSVWYKALKNNSTGTLTTGTAGTIQAGVGTIDKLTVSTINATVGTVETLVGTTLTGSTIDYGVGTVDDLVASTANLALGTFGTVIGTVGTIPTLTNTTFQGALGTFGTVIGTVGTIPTLTNTTFQGALGTFGTVVGTVGTVSTLTVPTIGTFGNATNYVTIDNTKGLRMYGSATTWEDNMIDIGRVRSGPVGTAPTWGTFNGAEVLQFNDGTINSISFLSQIPHKAKVGGSVDYHVHVSPVGTEAGSVVWQFTHSWANIGGSFPTASTIVGTQVIDANSNDKHILYDLGNLGTNPGISSMLACTLTRIGTETEDNFGTIRLLQSDFHYEVDSIGSDTKLTKT